MTVIHPLVGAKCRCSCSINSSSSACNFRTSPSGVCPSHSFQDGAKTAEASMVAEKMIQEGKVLGCKSSIFIDTILAWTLVIGLRHL